MDVLDGKVATCHFRNRFLSFSGFFPMTGRVLPDLDRARWGDGFICPHCQGKPGELFRIATRPGVLARP